MGIHRQFLYLRIQLVPSLPCTAVHTWTCLFLLKCLVPGIRILIQDIFLQKFEDQRLEDIWGCISGPGNGFLPDFLITDNINEVMALIDQAIGYSRGFFLFHEFDITHQSHIVTPFHVGIINIYQEIFTGLKFQQQFPYVVKVPFHFLLQVFGSIPFNPAFIRGWNEYRG